MAAAATPLGVRMPAELKQWLSQQAQRNRRSLNQEVVKRLEDGKFLEEVRAGNAAQ